MTDVASWLQSLGLEAYADAFAAQHIEMGLLRDLSDSDLRELGIRSLGHRKLLLRAAASLAVRSTLDASASNPAAPPTAARNAAAERRQLSVMFCDLVDSTVLAATLDPEDFRGILRSYHDTACREVSRFGGFVAQLLGDGVLAYFGYPQAHEDDAERAVRAAIEVIRAVNDLKLEIDAKLATRVGIATGSVVVGEIGTGAAAEASATGDTPNLAARLQGVAQPGQVVVSGRTHELIGDVFEADSLGLLHLKGFSIPTPAWLVLRARVVGSRFEGQHAHELSEFVGRGGELQILLQRWELAREGVGQVVLLSGEPGIGKSRICLVFRDRLAGAHSASVAMQCSPHDQGSAFYPVVRYLERAALICGAGGVDPGPGALPARLLKDVRTSGQAKAQVLSDLSDYFLSLAEKQPLLLLVEDMHWVDSATEELFGLLVERLRGARMLALMTCRSGYRPPWPHPEHQSILSLGRISQGECATLLRSVIGKKSLPEEIEDEILHKTDGIPLFVEELTKMVVRSDLLEDEGGRYRLNRSVVSSLAIPSTLQDSLRARFDQLGVAREVAQVGAVIGREFPRSLLSGVFETELQEALDELIRSELVYRRGVPPSETYTFRHALIRDTAYKSMLKTHRALRHGQVARVMEQVNPEMTTSQPELLAFHHQEAGNVPQAFDLWARAASLAAARSAGREAAMHFRAAIALLPRLGLGDRVAAAELDLRMGLGRALMQTEGYRFPETRQCYERAQELATRLDELDKYVAASNGVAPTLFSVGQFSKVTEMFDRIEPADIMKLNRMSHVSRSTYLGIARLLRGEQSLARIRLSEALRSLDQTPPGQRHFIAEAEPEIPILAYSARQHVINGFLDQAEACVIKSLVIAQERGHAATRAWALQMDAFIAVFRGDPERTAAASSEMLLISRKLGIKTRASSGVFYGGVALVAQGHAQEGVRMLKEGYSQWATSGGTFHCTEYASIAAHALLSAGLVDEARAFVALGDQVQQDTEERHFQAELIRLHGRLKHDDPGAAEALYREAIQVADGQAAKLFTLRAATDLAFLCRSHGRADEGRRILQPHYEWFTEGFAFPDLARARAFLAA